MKDQVKSMFEQITMPQSTEEKIRAGMVNHRKTDNNGRKLWHHLTAAAAVLALVLLISPEARAAVEGWVVRYIFPESGITVYEGKTSNGCLAEIVCFDTETPAFAHVEGGRLIFTGNGENLDITDRITEEEPFIYTYVDEAYGLTHHMVVGYQGSIENFGTFEFFREEAEGQKPWEGWSNGYGRNYLDEDMECYPWVAIVWQKLEVPWPMSSEN